MRICFVTSEFVNPYQGGVERVTYDLYNAMKSQGHKVFIISKEKPHDNTEKDEEYCINLPEENTDSNKNLEFLSDFIIEHRIEFVVNNSHHHSTFMLLTKVKDIIPFKLVSTIHTDPTYLVKGLRDTWDATLSKNINKLFILYYILRFIARYYMRRNSLIKRYKILYDYSDALVVLSEHYVPEILKLLKQKSSDKIFTISNPLINNGNHTCKKEKIVIWVGRMEYEAKRPDRIIKIWEKLGSSLKEWKLYMVGEGALKSSLEEYCRERNICNVLFTGRTNPIPLYQKAEIICLTSTHEGFGMVLIEALQHNVIPIAFDSYGAVHDIITNGENGLLIEPFNMQMYANCLSNIINDDELRFIFRNNISQKKNIEKFYIDNIVNQWIALFKSLK